jgi:hypothetical protein
MKKNNSKILLTVFIILALLLTGRYICDLVRKKVPEGMVLVKQETVDSLQAYIRIADSLKKLAFLPPDTIHKTDTVYLDTLKEVITTPEVEVDPTDSTLTTGVINQLLKRLQLQ